VVVLCFKFDQNRLSGYGDVRGQNQTSRTEEEGAVLFFIRLILVLLKSILYYFFV